MPTKARITEAEWFATFGEPTRLVLIRALARGEKTVTELAKIAQTEIVNVYHHLKVMKAGGLVAAAKAGRSYVYSLIGATASGGMLEFTHASEATVVIPLG